MANPNIPIALKIPAQGYDELEQIASHALKLGDVVQESASQNLDAKIDQVRKSVADRIHVPSETAGLLLSGLATLRDLMQQNDSDSAEIVEAISQALAESDASEWRERNLEKWTAARPLIEAALQSITSDHPLLLRQKALELTYAHQNIFRRSRIMTDLRPVYNTAGDAIVGMVLTHVLSIEYFDGIRSQRIEFALDELDADNLREATDRAKTKTDAARKKFAEMRLPLIVAGAE